MRIILGQWLYSLKHYALMCLLLSSPARLPVSPYPIILTAFVYFLIGLLLVDAQHSYPQISAQIFLELLMLGLIGYVALRLKDSLPRLQQTVAALYGITVVITAASVPVYRLAAAKASLEVGPLDYLMLMILLWNLAALSLIFKRSFEISTQLSAMLSFGFFIAYRFIVTWLFP